jgi:hypothetical protein
MGLGILLGWLFIASGFALVGAQSHGVLPAQFASANVAMLAGIPLLLVGAVIVLMNWAHNSYLAHP